MKQHEFIFLINLTTYRVQHTVVIGRVCFCRSFLGQNIQNPKLEPRVSVLPFFVAQLSLSFGALELIAQLNWPIKEEKEREKFVQWIDISMQKRENHVPSN